jgi:hypothetical protein
MASMRQSIARALIKTRVGLTTRELSDELQLKPAVIGMDLAKMVIEGTAIKGEYIEGEGQLWEITEKGVELYATKDDLEVKVITQAKPKNKPMNEIKSVKKPVEVKNEVIVAENLCAGEITECEPLANDIEVTDEEVAEFKLPEMMPPKHSMTPESFLVWQIVDDAGGRFMELLNTKKAKPIENIDYKIATLESLADISNAKISATLREIATDLRN